MPNILLKNSQATNQRRPQNSFFAASLTVTPTKRADNHVNDYRTNC